MKYLILLSFLFVAACNSKTNQSEAEQKASDSTSIVAVEYEYYGGATDDGYLYHKLSLNQNGNEISGTIFSGTYLGKSEQGFYTMPAATITCNLTGKAGAKDEIMMYLGSISDTSRMDYSYTYPDQRKLFGEDANGDAVQAIYKTGKDFRWVINGDTLLFSKIQAAPAN
ncbi:hypothetical protein WSM22_24380 [Cytophagales bacterium WSM2-2]|nr:hypothetical protein WSM22_24380 [Cytophagales bacterium WSM2-2]